MRTLRNITLFAFCSLFTMGMAHAQLTGQGPVVKQELDLPAFRSIGLGASGTVYLYKGNTQKVEVEGQQNIIDALRKDVRNRSWNIGFDQRVRNYRKLVIHITLPTVEDLSIGGSGSIIAKDAFDAGDMKMSIGGSGAIEFAGTAGDVMISIGGSGSVKAGDLKAANCRVSIGGSGSAFIEVADKLDVSIAGSGNVHYKGRPVINSSVAGSGKVINM
jgi:hypothetical protein